jgi:hypothetical protein
MVREPATKKPAGGGIRCVGFRNKGRPTRTEPDKGRSGADDLLPAGLR